MKFYDVSFLRCAAFALSISLIAALSGVCPASADTAPHIVAVTTSGSRVRSGDTFSVTVVARNAASVTAHFVNQTIALQRDKSGDYEFSYKIPWVPFFVKRTYSMTIVATNRAGQSTSRDIPVTLE
jgi:hypothetical protein